MKILLVTGGSGGHLIPAMAVAEQLPQETCVILTSAKAIDKKLQAGFAGEWHTMELQPWRPWTRWIHRARWREQYRFLKAISQKMDAIRPCVVVGFGGYFSFCVLMLARWKKIPTLIQEQNVYLGTANKFLKYFVKGVGLSFEETRQYLRTKKKMPIQVTGNPVRSVIGSIDKATARRTLNLDERPVLLVMGGSQGAQAINRLATSMWELISPEERANYQVIHLTGSPEESQWIAQIYQRMGVRARTFDFYSRIAEVYAAADLYVGRAGATTLAELIQAQLPAIFIPYPHAGAHQRANALWLQERGAAVMVEQSTLTPDKLMFLVHERLGQGLADGMQACMKDCHSHVNGAAKRFADWVMTLAQAS